VLMGSLLLLDVDASGRGRLEGRCGCEGSEDETRLGMSDVFVPFEEVLEAVLKNLVMSIGDDAVPFGLI